MIEKACLCEGLSASERSKAGPAAGRKELAVAVCPGPNLAYFARTFSLDEMVGHIYGRVQLLAEGHRPNMFIQELRLYVDYLKDEVRRRIDSLTGKDLKYLAGFAATLQQGIEYYKTMIPKLLEETERYRRIMMEELLKYEEDLAAIEIPGTELEPVPTVVSGRG